MEKALSERSCKSCPVGAHLIWHLPIYKFIIPSDIGEDGEVSYKQVLIDVSNSPPPFPTPGTLLGSVLDEVLKLTPKKSVILDFGAGKLRNALYLLQRGYEVCAVEFDKIRNSSDQAKQMYMQAEGFSTFNKLVFPHEFFESTRKFDLILLINVCNIMPVQAERYLILQYCRSKLKKNGYVLWYTQHRDPDYVKRCVSDVSIGDGYYMNKMDKYQTFYRDFESYEIDGMFLANGFRFQRSFETRSQARLYKKIGDNPLEDIPDAELIRRHIRADIPIEEPKTSGVQNIVKLGDNLTNLPNPNELKEEEFYIKALNKLPAGKRYQTTYHNLVAAIMIKLFMPPLKNPRLEYDLSDGRKRIDLVMSNRAENGFFADLPKRFDVLAPYIFVECKNYAMDMSNPEIDQIAGRFKNKWGSFGFLTYRRDSNTELLLQRCQDCVSQDRYIVTLSDEEIITMLRHKTSDQDLYDSLDEKMQLLLFD